MTVRSGSSKRPEASSEFVARVIGDCTISGFEGRVTEARGTFPVVRFPWHEGENRGQGRTRHRENAFR